jgi:hypothetical protein
LALHDAGFVEFLRVAWDECSQTEYEDEIIPICWPPAECPNEFLTSLTARLATIPCPQKPQSTKAHGRPLLQARM